VRSAGPAHIDAGNPNGFSKVTYLGFDFAFIVDELGLFSSEFLYRLEKLVVFSVGRLRSQRYSRKNTHH